MKSKRLQINSAFRLKAGIPARARERVLLARVRINVVQGDDLIEICIEKFSERFDEICVILRVVNKTSYKSFKVVE